MEVRIFDEHEIYTIGASKEVYEEIQDLAGTKGIITLETFKQKQDRPGQDKVKLRLVDYEQVL